MSNNDNLIVCSDINGKINDLFKVSLQSIIGDVKVNVSPQYEKENFNKMSFTGSGEFTGIYYNDESVNSDGQNRGNALGCRGVYVIGVYSDNKGDLKDKVVTLYLSDKQLSTIHQDEQGVKHLIKQCTTATDTFEASYYENIDKLKEHLTESFNKLNNVSSDIKFSYIPTSHQTDIFEYVPGSFSSKYLTARFKCVLSRTYASLFTGVFGWEFPEGSSLLRTYDTAIFSYDMLDFGTTEIYPTCFSVGTNNASVGDGNITSGMGSRAYGAFSAAFGRSSQARGYTTFAAGHRSKALIEKSVALGDQCTTKGTGSFAAGNQSITNSGYSVALGNNCRTEITSQCVVGRYNCKNSTALFAVGGGTGTTVKDSAGNSYKKIDSKNIFEVTTQGKIIVPIQNTDPCEFAYIEINKNASGTLRLDYGKVSAENTRAKTIWQDSNGNETTTDPTI